MAQTQGLPETQFVMINYFGERRVVTFYKNQPVTELRELLTALFPGVSNGEAIPVGVERSADNLVVPLSAGAKFPEVMTGQWELLVIPRREIESEKNIIREFSKGMYKEGFIGERAMKDLLLLVEEEDRPLLYWTDRQMYPRKGPNGYRNTCLLVWRVCVTCWVQSLY